MRIALSLQTSFDRWDYRKSHIYIHHLLKVLWLGRIVYGRRGVSLTTGGCDCRL